MQTWTKSQPAPLEVFGAITGGAVAAAPEARQLREVEMDRIARLAGMPQFQPAEAVASRL